MHQDIVSSVDPFSSSAFGPSLRNQLLMSQLEPLIGTLPIWQMIPQILESIENNDITVIEGGTGCGKSTGIPLALLLSGQRVFCTEPRRLVASSLADRVSSLIGEKSGTKVGVLTAGEKRHSEDETRLTYCTDGYYLAALLAGNEPQSDVLALDEIHEWNKNVELIKAIWQFEKSRGKKLPKLVILSATLDKGEIRRSIGPGFNVGEITVPGRGFPITQEWMPDADLAEEIAKSVAANRDSLSFLPGKAEIYSTKKKLDALGLDAEIIPLHRELSRTEQHRCFDVFDRPKVILSTNIAETGITPDVDDVFSVGLKRQIDIRNGIQRLELRLCSRFDLLQQMGRCGRTKEGRFVLLSQTSFEERPKKGRAEMERSRLELDILRLLASKYELSELPLTHRPPRRNVENALGNLMIHNCIRTRRGKIYITEHGRECAFLPAQFELGILIKEAERAGIENLAILCAAVIEAEGIAERIKGQSFYDAPYYPWCAEEKRADPLAHARLLVEAHKLRMQANDDEEAFKKSMQGAGLDPVRYQGAMDSFDMLVKDRSEFEIPESIPNGETRAKLISCFVKAFQAHAYLPLEGDMLLSEIDGERELSRDSFVDPFAVRNGVVFGYPFTIQDRHLVSMAVIAGEELVRDIVPSILLPDRHDIHSRQQSANGNGRGNGKKRSNGKGAASQGNGRRRTEGKGAASQGNGKRRPNGNEAASPGDKKKQRDTSGRVSAHRRTSGKKL